MAMKCALQVLKPIINQELMTVLVYTKPRPDKDEKSCSLAAKQQIENLQDLLTLAISYRMAEENNIVFLPIQGKTHEGKPVYRCQSTKVYIDRGVLFMLVDHNQYKPVALQKRIDTAKM